MISFVVPAHNEERFIDKTLQSIHESASASDEPYEIIVVDDASTDQTSRIAREHGAKVVSVVHRKISATRNAGARIASGRMLIFVDADTQISRPVVAAALEVVSRGAAGGGATIRFDGVVPLYARMMLPALTLSFRITKTAAGCFIFCTREAFAAVGGFDESYYGAEEVVMSKALKTFGSFVILEIPVITSGRKLRAYTASELLIPMLRLALGGRKAVQRREGLDLWYAERRPDP